MERAILAERLGFDSVFVGEHHSVPGSAFYDLLQLLTYIAASTRRLKVGTGVIVAPFHDPLLLAESLATLDLLSNGRSIFGVGMGYRPQEFDVLGKRIKDRVSATTECIEMVRRLWTKKLTTYEGRFWKLKNAALNYRPVQKPHPPIWYGASTEKGIRRAARIADSWFGISAYSEETLAHLIKIYQNEMVRTGISINKIELPLIVETSVGPTVDKARTLIEEQLVMKWREYARWGLELIKQDPKLSELRPEEITFDVLKERFLIGSYDECIETVEHLRNLGVSHLVIRPGVLSTNEEIPRKIMTDFAHKVMPYFRRLKAKLN